MCPYSGGYQYPQPPQQPVVFIPSPAAPPPTGPFDLKGITEAIAGLEALKKMVKEEKKDDKPKDDKKKPDVSVPALMLFMLLIAPITGPVVLKLFLWGTSLLH